MANIDLKRHWSDQYRARPSPSVVEIPERRFLMVDGMGDPNTGEQYAAAIETLYPLAYGLRSAVKAATGDAYTVLPLEALWWADDMSVFGADDRSSWKWTAMICLPEAVTPSILHEVIPTVIEAKKLPAANEVRVEAFAEGLAAQVLHVGPYSAEGPTIAALHSFIASQGGALSGKHHEIYLSDARKTAPEKLRTIIRQPYALI